MKMDDIMRAVMADLQTAYPHLEPENAAKFMIAGMYEYRVPDKIAGMLQRHIMWAAEEAYLSSPPWDNDDQPDLFAELPTCEAGSNEIL